MNHFLLRTACAITLCAATTLAQGQAWPAKTIRIIVPYPAGGGTDIIARVTAEKLQAALGQAVVVENRAGANGIIGTEAVARDAGVQPSD